MNRGLRAHLAGSAVTALLIGAPLDAGPVEIVDQGNFILYQNDRAVGAEVFTVEVAGDSLIVASRLYETRTTDRGDEQFEKQMMLIASRSDFGLRSYQSTMTFRGQKLTRGIVMGDTALTLYRESEQGGVGDRIVAPPGRIFVVDARLFTLFDLICLSLHGKTFDSRPLTMLTLGARDSVLEATATDLGSETIRWGARPVQTRKLQITDGSTTFMVWANSAGKMLRLEHRESATRVERQPPAIKKRTAPPKPGG